jgi:multidrug efflux pump subunit AcrA (membrane-fusion protein)
MNAVLQEEPEPHTDPVSALLHLARRARHAASATELGFIIVNETFALTRYRQAALWSVHTGVMALSGVVTPEANAPFVHWLDRVASKLSQRQLSKATLIDAQLLQPADAAEWDEWLPAHAVWLPLTSGAATNKTCATTGGILLARDEPWHAGEMSLLSEWVDTWNHAWQAFQQRKPATSGLLRWLQRPRVSEPKPPLRTRWRASWQPLRAALLHPASWPDGLHRLGSGLLMWIRGIWHSPMQRYGVLALLCALLPVRLSVLVPGELVPMQPAAVRAPQEGIVDRFFVTPNQKVQQGEPLFQLDLTALTSKLDVARQEQATAEAEYRQAAQQAVFDPRSKSQLAALQGRIAEHATEVEYLQAQLTRAQITAPRAGVVLMDDPTEWIGRPVAVGERVLTIADEHDVEIEAWLAPFDAIELARDATVTLYLNATPLHPVRARLRYVAHEAIARPDGTFAYRLRATITPDDGKPRIGLKGTARVSGGYVPLIYWVARRPLAAVRPWIGW